MVCFSCFSLQNIKMCHESVQKMIRHISFKELVCIHVFLKRVKTVVGQMQHSKDAGRKSRGLVHPYTVT